VQGAVALALGTFTHDERKIIAPFELKGTDTKNLDAIIDDCHFLRCNGAALAAASGRMRGGSADQISETAFVGAII
jgi:hypothetical protein